ncbi:hypothetical protein GCM10009648_38930 [Tsukamurella spumae]
MIRRLPFTTDKAAVERASGVSRPTIYRLLEEGHHHVNSEPNLLTDAASVREYIARLKASRANPEDIVDEFVTEAEYTIGNRRTDGADWEWPDLDDSLDAANTWRQSRTDADFDVLLDLLSTEASRIEADVQGAIDSQ